ncbi:MAG: tetratricopeptide repeat protein [Candidatus Scalindua sp.]
MFFSSQVFASSVSKSVDEGNKLYNQGKYDEAIEKYSEARDESPDSDIVNFNLGTALYKKGQYTGAIEAFTRALNTEEREIEMKAIYNMANSKYQLGSRQANTDLNGAIALYRESLDYYKRAIELNESERDAKYNHELVEKQLKILLDRLKNQPPMQEEDQEQDKQDKDDQKAGSQSNQDRKGEEQQNQQQEQEAEQKEAESAEDQEKTAGKEGEETEGQPESREEEEQKMSPEEARMLLEAYGQEEGREEMKKSGRRYYKGALKDW